MLGFLFALASMAFARDGQPFLLGTRNIVQSVTTLVKQGGGPALNLQVDSGPPLKVDSATKVAMLNADKLDGKDFGAFGAKEVIDASGPLPVEGTFTSRGGTLIVSVSGSGYRGTGSSRLPGMIGMDVRIDGAFQDVLGVYTNERNSHKAFVSKDLVVRGFSAGEHTVTLGRIYAAVACNQANGTRDHYCTATDFNDRFHVTVTEIPD